MTESTTCMGCLLHPAFLNKVPCNCFHLLPAPKVESLTDEETQILRLLGDAWSLYTTLDKRTHHDNSEFTNAIHDAQKLIALRVARRVNPTVWNQP
jgi:hypothetical protein